MIGKSGFGLILVFLLLGVLGYDILERDTDSGVNLRKPVYVDGSRYMKAVHYFGASWPITFWSDFETSRVDADLQRIKADGFNTVILVLPWVGFAEGMTEPNPLYKRFRWLLQRIDAAHLNVALRVGFPHSFDPNKDTGTRVLCRRFFTDPQMRQQWLNYLGRLQAEIGHFANYIFSFFSWEDFFCALHFFPFASAQERLELARDIGYQRWLTERYSLKLIKAAYGQEFANWEQVPLPGRKSFAYYFYQCFVDTFYVHEFLEPGRHVMPRLSMEVRVDKDPLYLPEGMYWLAHDLRIGSPLLRGSYWSPSYGARNEGETLDAETALRNLEFMLDTVSGQGQDSFHVLEQFNFIDNTPHLAATNARIADDEVAAFLDGAAELLLRNASGYGLWAYRDYADNVFYNSSFELGLHGWRYQGSAELTTNSSGDTELNLSAGTRLRQTMQPSERFTDFGYIKQLTFCALLRRGSLGLEVAGQRLATLTAARSPTQVCAPLSVDPWQREQLTIELVADADVRFDDLMLYGHVQRLGVYALDGSPGPWLESVRQLNRQLSAQ